MQAPGVRSNGDTTTFWLVVVLGVAAALRFWNLTAELPYGISIDEPEVVERAVKILQTGDFHPHFFDYPTLYIYVQFLVALGRFLLGAAVGEYSGLHAFGAADLYPWARACSAALGTATVWVTFLVGRRYGTGAALAGAALLAVFPSHSRESHFALTDIPLTLLVTITWLATLRASEAPSIKAFAIAGAVAGLAAGTKYNGAIVILLPLAAALMTANARRALTATAAICAAALAAFVIAAPYSVLDMPAFLDRFASLNREYLGARGIEPPWLTYLKHLRMSLAWPATVIAFVGILTALVGAAQGPRRIIWILPLLIIVPNFWLISSRTIVYARYLLPLVPALCLLGGVALAGAIRRLQAWRPGTPSLALATALVAVLFTAPLDRAIGFGRQLGRPSTRRETYEWLSSHVARGTPLAIEGGVLRMPRHFYAVTEVNHLTDVPLETYRAAGVKYLIASSDHFADGNGKVKPQYGPYFAVGRVLFTVDPSEQMAGPEIRVYDVTP